MARLPRWCIGPWVVVPGLLWLWIAAGRARVPFPGAARPLLRVLGFLLFFGGIVVLAFVNRRIRRATRAGRLTTDGPYAVVRNPIYAGWILLLLPGAALLTGSWTALGAPLLSALIFRLLLPVEERLLEERFGLEYRAYRSRTPALIPRFGRRGPRSRRSAGPSP